MQQTLWILAVLAGAGIIVGGAELFAEHLSRAATRLGTTTFALAVLLAGAEPEELATVVTASLRDAPGLGLGDVVGANVAVVLVALGVAALVRPFSLRGRPWRYGLAGLAAGTVAVAFAWDGSVGRAEGALLVLGYAAFVTTVWRAEHAPPALGETGELAEAAAAEAGGESTGESARSRRVGRELGLSLLGVAGMVGGSVLLVEAVQRLTGVESTQTRLGMTVVGFATAFELVVLAWSASRRGMSETAVAGVVGSFAYNATMTLGAGALARPLTLADAGLLRVPAMAMLGALVVAMARGRRRLDRRDGLVLLGLYPVFVAVALLA